MTYSRTIFTAAAALVALAPAQAVAQNTANDVRCLIVSNVFAKSAKEAKAKELANSAMLFYAGRVSSLSNAQIEAGLSAQQKEVNATNAGPTMKACASAIDGALKNISAVGQKLQPPKPPATK
jgi:hypothetical protein